MTLVYSDEFIENSRIQLVLSAVDIKSFCFVKHFMLCSCCLQSTSCYSLALLNGEIDLASFSWK